MKMASREKTVAEIWTIYASFVITFFMFVFMIQLFKPTEKPIAPVIIGALAFAAVTYVPIGATLRKRFLDGAAESLRKDPQDAKGLRLWRRSRFGVAARPSKPSAAVTLPPA